MTYEQSEIQEITEEEPTSEMDNSYLLHVHECPLCKKKIPIKVDFILLEQLYREFGGVIPHIILHGEPLHAMLCYVDKHMVVRGKAHIVSIAISRDSVTYQQLVKSWSRSSTEIID